MSSHSPRSPLAASRWRSHSCNLHHWSLSNHWPEEWRGAARHLTAAVTFTWVRPSVHPPHLVVWRPLLAALCRRSSCFFSCGHVCWFFLFISPPNTAVKTFVLSSSDQVVNAFFVLGGTFTHPLCFFFFILYIYIFIVYSGSVRVPEDSRVKNFQ